MTHPKHWPWSSWSFHENGESGLLRIDPVDGGRRLRNKPHPGATAPTRSMSRPPANRRGSSFQHSPVDRCSSIFSLLAATWRTPMIGQSLTRILLLVSLFNASSMASHGLGTACTGADPCYACKNCKYCKHCAKDGGTCGVCRRNRAGIGTSGEGR